MNLCPIWLLQLLLTHWLMSLLLIGITEHQGSFCTQAAVSCVGEPMQDRLSVYSCALSKDKAQQIYHLYFWGPQFALSNWLSKHNHLQLSNSQPVCVESWAVAESSLRQTTDKSIHLDQRRQLYLCIVHVNVIHWCLIVYLMWLHTLGSLMTMCWCQKRERKPLSMFKK